MTNEDFCKNDTEYYGEVVDNIKQIVKRSFTGEQLKEYVEHHIAQYSKNTVVSGSFSAKDMENLAAKCMIFGNSGKTTKELLKDFCDNDR